MFGDCLCPCALLSSILLNLVECVCVSVCATGESKRALEIQYFFYSVVYLRIATRYIFYCVDTYALLLAVVRVCVCECV